DTVELVANATDVEMDPLRLEWAVGGEFGPVMNLTEDNMTMSHVLEDDGPLTFQVRVTDDDNASDIAEVSIEAENVAPTFVHRIYEEGVEGDLDVVQGENVTVRVSDVFDPSSDDIFTIVWTIDPDDGLSNYTFDDGASLALIFIEARNYTLTINVSDEDGGFSSVELSFSVSENISFDQDGDGIPKFWEDKYGLSDTFADDASMDLDSDDLTNLREYELGTDPRDPDSDDDGVPDRWDGYPRDPARYDMDSDGDGHYDWDEFNAGTDPNDSEDYPGRKDASSDDSIWLWLVLIAVGFLLIVGVVVLWASRSARKGMEYEE
ncbi:MAG: hypothetical protein ACMUHY_09900, partial [Thermoplasmatota archaeon]